MAAADRALIIAEVGQAHDGSLGMAHAYIDAAATAGVDAVKFQTHIADAESSPVEPFRVAFSYQDASRQDYWRRMEFTPDQWLEIKRHCEAVAVEFMSTPACVAAVDLLERLGVRRYKIGSGDTDNRLLLDRVARTGKQILLSTGMSTLGEIDQTMSFLGGFHARVVIMQCTTEYPVAPEKVGLGLIPVLATRYRVPVGLSDHSGTIYPSIAARALGATYLEAHIVFDRRMFGPDTVASVTIEEMKEMVAGVRLVEASLAIDERKSGPADRDRLRSMFGKTLCVSRPMTAGDVIAQSDLESKKPAGQGIAAADFMRAVGRVLRRDMEQWEFLTDEHLT